MFEVFHLKDLTLNIIDLRQVDIYKLFVNVGGGLLWEELLSISLLLNFILVDIVGPFFELLNNTSFY